MKNLLKRIAHTLDQAVRHLEEHRPKAPRTQEVIDESNRVLEEVAKLPRLKTGDVDALEIALNVSKCITHPERMKAQRALRFLKVHAGNYRAIELEEGEEL